MCAIRELFVTMYLSKLEIQGFKSFAEKAVLEFNHDLTAIVGPNGSGKSNIADAVRWVLGEQSIKLLRGKKSEDVIFAGSGNRVRLGLAEVSIYLNNEDGQAPIDYREVVITRRLYRNGESEYLLNKNKVRLTDIQLLLAKSNFGQRTYSIIGQGMIDSILVASAVERKEFFDEATGVRQYQIKREQAFSKLEHSQQNLAQSQGVLTEIEPRLRSLARQAKKLERREELAKALNELQVKYYSRLFNDLNGEASQQQQKIEKLATAKKRVEEKIHQAQQEIERLQSQDTQAEAFKKLQEQYAELTHQKNKLLQELALVKGKMDLELTKMGQADLVWAKNKAAEIAGQLAVASRQKAEQEKVISQIISQLEDKTQRQLAILKEYQDLQAKLLVAQKNFTGGQNFSYGKIQAHVSSLYQKQQAFLEALDKIKELQQLSKLKKQAEEVAKEINWLLGKLAGALGNESEDFLKIQGSLNSFLVTKDSLVNEIHELKVALAMAEQKKQQLTGEQEKLAKEKGRLELELAAASSNDQQVFNKHLSQSQHDLSGRIDRLDKELGVLQTQLAGFAKDQEQSKNQLFIWQRSLRDLQLELNAISNEYNEIKIALAKIETRKEDLEKELAAEMTGDFQPLEQMAAINLGEAYAEIGRLKNQLAIIGGIDEEVTREYTEVKERYDFLNEQITDLEGGIIACQDLIAELDEKIKIQFEDSFEQINKRFMHYFKILFNGGNAKLLLQRREINEKDPEESDPNSGPAEIENNISEKPSAWKKKYEVGIEIQATPPGKKLKFLNMLSGGEKALTSIALVSAIIANNPSPFVILDEVDAALDEANSQRFARIVEELSDKTQFVCITHNRATMEQAAILYGVTMGNDGVSKLLSINLTEAEKVPA